MNNYIFIHFFIKALQCLLDVKPWADVGQTLILGLLEIIAITVGEANMQVHKYAIKLQIVESVFERKRQDILLERYGWQVRSSQGSLS